MSVAGRYTGTRISAFDPKESGFFASRYETKQTTKMISKQFSDVIQVRQLPPMTTVQTNFLLYQALIESAVKHAWAVVLLARHLGYA